MLFRSSPPQPLYHRLPQIAATDQLLTPTPRRRPSPSPPLTSQLRQLPDPPNPPPIHPSSSTSLPLSCDPSCRGQRRPIPPTSTTTQQTHELLSDPSVCQDGWIRRSRSPVLAPQHLACGWGYSHGVAYITGVSPVVTLRRKKCPLTPSPPLGWRSLARRARMRWTGRRRCVLLCHVSGAAMHMWRPPLPREAGGQPSLRALHRLQTEQNMGVLEQMLLGRASTGAMKGEE